MPRRTKIIAASAFCMLLSTATSAEEGPTPEQLAAMATENRQAVFKLLGVHMAPIVGMARGAVPFDAAVAERNARRIAMLAPMIPERFAAMDTREFDVATEALPVIWETPDDFAAKAKALEDAANTFAGLAAGGDQATTLGGLRAFGGTCGNCHDSYRVDED
ncbi:MAG TPA: cytochrome c [Pseudomonadales bacterium]